MLKTRAIVRAIRVCAVSALVGLSCAAQADLNALLDMPLPDKARLALVGADMVHNSSRMSIATYHSHQHYSEVLEFYRLEWFRDEDLPGYVEYESGGWSIIARLQDGVNLALQVRDDGQGKTTGLVSALELEDAGEVYMPSIAIPAGAELLSSTRSQDGSRGAHTWLLRSHSRPGEVTSFYRDHLQRNGWKVVSDRAMARSSILLLSGSSGTMEVTASSDQDGTLVIVNRVRSES